jgi:hypothetical protein
MNMAATILMNDSFYTQIKQSIYISIINLYKHYQFILALSIYINIINISINTKSTYVSSLCICL